MLLKYKKLTLVGYCLFGVNIGKLGGDSDNLGDTKDGISELTDSVTGALVGGTDEVDSQYQIDCCCCKVHVFQALGFSILFPRK